MILIVVDYVLWKRIVYFTLQSYDNIIIWQEEETCCTTYFRINNDNLLIF